jgi:ATP-dependent DNA ligase
MPANRYAVAMRPRRPLPADFVEPSIPTLAAKPPSGAGWVRGIKHDGYRLIVPSLGDGVRPFTRRGYGWTEPIPLPLRSIGPKQLDRLDV